MDLFSSSASQASITFPDEGICHIQHLADASVLIPLILSAAKQAPFRHMMTPMGHPTQVAMTNCGDYGWTSSPKGYGYSSVDPESQQPWPKMASGFKQLCDQAIQLAGLPEFDPDSMLINRYSIGHAMGRHQDKDEADFNEPIVSVSLGLPAIYQYFGEKRNGAKSELALHDGDVVILFGPARLYYHGVKAIKADPLNPNSQYRYNLTFRRASKRG